jgi:cobalt/nickel transport system permease protein
MYRLHPLSDAGPIQELDPRVRIVAAVAFAVVVGSGRDLLMLGVATVLAVGLAVLARLPLRETLKRLLAVDLFIVVMLMMLPFTVPGESLLELGPLRASREGLLRAVEIVLKANGIVLALLALVGTLDAATLGHGLHHLRVPDKLIHLLLFTTRYVEVLQQEYGRLRTAMRARAFRPRSDWHTWRSIGYLFGMLLVRTLERSERIAAAMKCRGFQGRFYLLDHFTMRRRDWVFAGVIGACLVGLMGVELG